jgi:type I restriction enzyme S subunit
MALTGGTIGKIIRVVDLEEEVLQNYRVGKFVPKDTRTLDKDFMFWVLSSEFTFAQILYLQRETGQPNIGIGDFSKMFFPMPNTLEEQGEIAAYIVEQKIETNTLISKYQKQIDLMQEYRTAIISQAVKGKIDVRDWQPKTKEIIS